MSGKSHILKEKKINHLRSKKRKLVFNQKMMPFKQHLLEIEILKKCILHFYFANQSQKDKHTGDNAMSF